MELREKLKKLRLASGSTQEAVAEQLGISAQTISKWERGLLLPDIMLLPRLAVLYRCSIDSLFDMESVWGIQHQKEFEDQIRKLYALKDYEGAYRQWIKEIELKPDNFSNYIEVMLLVTKQKMFDDEHVRRMLLLAEHAESYCFDDDIRNEIHRSMLKICSESKTPEIKEMAVYYYKKLPMLRHSREVYAKYVMDDESYREQIKKNIIYTIDLSECAIRQLMTPYMSKKEKLFYYIKAAELFEVVLDDKYGGFYDVPLLSDYAEIASLYMQLGDKEQAQKYVDRIISVMQKHISGNEKQVHSKLIYATELPNCVPKHINCQKILNRMINEPNLQMFNGSLRAFEQKYNEFFNK